MLSKELEFTLNSAFRDAREKRHEFMTVRAPAARPARQPRRGQGAARLRRRDREAAAARSCATSRRTPRCSPRATSARPSPRSDSSACSSAPCSTCSPSGKKEVTGANVLVAIFGERESQAVYFLNRQDVTRLDVVNYISHGISKVHDNEEGEAFNSPDEDEKPAEAESKEPAGGVRHAPQPAGAPRQDRSPDRTPRRGRAHGPDPVPAAQEQPSLRRRGGRRQDRDRGRAREDDRRRRRAGGAGEVRHLRARPGRPARGHQVPGRLREAAEGGPGPARQGRGGDPLHRRDSHHHRRRRGVRRSHGRVQPHQADARVRRPALHRLHDLPRVSRGLREGPGAVEAVPEDRRGASRRSRRR